MIFKIALIGRTNVGKSTLFNTLLEQNIAIVHHVTNFTRDRQYGVLHLDNDVFVNIIDTAGIEISYQKDSILQTSVLNQTFIAIDESDLILFVVNMQDGILEEDKQLINIIRKKSKTIFLVINKIDKIKNYQYEANNFFYLGIRNIFLISARKKLGITILKSKIKTWYFSYKKSQMCLLPSEINKKNNNSIQNIKISIIGKPNAGKSTLFNVLLKKNRSVTCNIPGTTRDSITDTIIFQNKKYIIVDTAGIRKKNSSTIMSLPVLKTLQTISNNCIVILVIDYHDGFNKKDIWLLNIMIKSGKKILILINKAEKLSSLEQNKIKKYLCWKYKIIRFFYIHFISALYKRGIKEIFFLIDKLHDISYHVMKASQLTKIMYQAIQKYPPKIVHGKQIKLQYAHPGGYNPPTIVIHGQQLFHITKNYRRYLINFFQDHLNFLGNTIKLVFKNKINPYNKN